MDPLSLSDAERAELKAWIALHKRLRPILHAGDGEFHLEPVDGRYVWGAAAKDQIAVVVAQGPTALAEQPAPMRLPELLVADGTWRIAGRHREAPDFIRVSEGQLRLLAGEIPFSAQTLTKTGLPLPMLRPQSGFVLELRRIAGV